MNTKEPLRASFMFAKTHGYVKMRLVCSEAT